MSESDYGIDIEQFGVPAEDGESWDELVRRRGGGHDRRDWHPCCLCGAKYRSRAPAIQCCNERFE